MTMSPGSPGPADFEGKAVPPYEGRRETADVDGEEELRKDGANVGGATGPVAPPTFAPSRCAFSSLSTSAPSCRPS